MTLLLQKRQRTRAAIRSIPVSCASERSSVSSSSLIFIHAVRLWLLLLLLSLSCCIVPVASRRSSSSSPRKGDMELSKACYPSWKRSPVSIEDVSLVCDSPGAYYGGNSAYQNSITCRQGDHAKLAIDFRILGKWDYSIGMNITIQASFYGKWITIKDHTDVCNFGSLAYSSPDNQNVNDDIYSGACPLRMGSYELFTSFTVPKFQPDKVLDFTPDLYVEFVNAANPREVVGCATTGTVALLDHEKRHARRGAFAFTISMLALVILFVICSVGHRRKARRNKSHGSYVNQAFIPESTLRRFQYRRTTRNGTVLVPDLSSATGAAVTVGSTISGRMGGDGSGNHNYNNMPPTNGEVGGGLSTFGLAGMSIPGGGHGDNNNNNHNSGTPLPLAATTTLMEVT